MEGVVALELMKKIFNKNKGKMYLKELVSDDNSTMRSLLQHKEHHEKDKLPDNIPQPKFCADPLHIIKVMAKPFLK